MTELDGRIELRALTGEDRGLLRAWLRRSDVQRWLGGAAGGEALIAIALDSELAICRMIVLDGIAIGYAQAVDAALLADARALDSGTWTCDIFIADAAQQGRGRGAAALDLLAGEVFRSTLALACAIRVSVRNEAAVRACEKVGFRWIGIAHDLGSGPEWQLSRARPRA